MHKLHTLKHIDVQKQKGEKRKKEWSWVRGRIKERRKREQKEWKEDIGRNSWRKKRKRKEMRLFYVCFKRN